MTKYCNRWMVAFLAMAALPLSGCQKHSASHPSEHPSHVEHIDGSDVSRVTLTEKAIERIDLQTTKVIERAMSPVVKIVPYSSILYDPHGGTWVYTSPAARTFVRHAIEIDRIEGDEVFLTDGPEVGTVIVTVAVAELYGSEFEVGH